MQTFFGGDDRWLRDASVTPVAGAQVVATRVPLTADGEHAANQMGGGAIAATDAHGVAALRALIDDEDIKALIDEVAATGTQLILLTTTGGVRLFGPARLLGLGRMNTKPANGTELQLDVDDVRFRTGTLLAVPGGTGAPTRIFLTG